MRISDWSSDVCSSDLKGFDLLPSMLALRQWGQKYSVECVENPVLVDERDRLPIGPVSILAHDGRLLGPHDLWLSPRENVGLRADGSRADVADLAVKKAVAGCALPPRGLPPVTERLGH